MKNKDTVPFLKRHDQFLESKDELKAMKRAGDKEMVKDRKEGLSEYRKGKATGKGKK